MFEIAFHALTQGFYLLVFVFLVRCLSLLWKHPFPANAPKFISGSPLVGAIRLFSDRRGFCHGSKAASPTGNYSYYLGRNRVVGLSGPQGRKTFFEHKDLSLDQGVELFVAVTNVFEQGDDPSLDTHVSYFRSTVRTALQRSQSLELVPAAIEACTTASLNRMLAKGLIDPFQELGWLYAESTTAALGIDDVASSINYENALRYNNELKPYGLILQERRRLICTPSEWS
ncbi:uncharacterized protein BO80DRAFT_442994 [Aspergillus ibericus CBS 121593]|uniref:Cytochrome P450 n=1 Tax=Aspergillus ibericus CBS 121593 TaxID=1448316 RepID=A0A395H6P6_9EURO|nr:hypothetical protein BO80DRAFT_442994 [Aspergillus ibericus CBS 121593]RAL03320.1 hypothetical protein BO80DRAFT_442994 [Aspergillus ibericus CBS 121593]